jgi:hypothetical protein
MGASFLLLFISGLRIAILSTIFDKEGVKKFRVFFVAGVD